MKKIIKYLFISFSIFFVIGIPLYFYLLAGSMTSGGLESGKYHYFQCSRGEIKTCIDSFLEVDSIYNVPEKWIHKKNYLEKNYDFMYGKCVYFNQTPEEMYYFSLVKNDYYDNDSTSPCILAVRIVYRGDNNNSQEDWQDDSEDIENRFDDFLDEVTKYCDCNRLKK